MARTIHQAHHGRALRGTHVVIGFRGPSFKGRRLRYWKRISSSEYVE
jgi:hypothetical protein